MPGINTVDGPCWEMVYRDFPSDTVDKNLLASVGDTGLSPVGDENGLPW